MPLNADAEPVGVDGFDSLDDTIGSKGTDPELGAGLANGLMVAAVHTNFPATVNLIDARGGLQEDSVAVGTAGSVPVRQSPREVLREVEI